MRHLKIAATLLPLLATALLPPAQRSLATRAPRGRVAVAAAADSDSECPPAGRAGASDGIREPRETNLKSKSTRTR